MHSNYREAAWTRVNSTCSYDSGQRNLCCGETPASVYPLKLTQIGAQRRALTTQENKPNESTKVCLM
jgi:hypothetical protein